MIIVMPTCDTHAHVAEWSACMLRRHWPDHPPLHVLHHQVRPKIDGAELHDLGPDRSVGEWAMRMTTFLEGVQDDTFLILLDDYSLCGPANAEVIWRADDLARRPETGFVRIGWQPGTPHAAEPGFVRLWPTLVTMQAAIWRRDYFLRLVKEVGPCSIWGFEGGGTQAIKRVPADIYAVDEEPDAMGFFSGASASKVLPYHNLMRRGRLADEHYDWLIGEGFNPPSRGLGDTIAKATHKLGIAQMVDKISSVVAKPCGCAGRQAALNEKVPYSSRGSNERAAPSLPQ